MWGNTLKMKMWNYLQAECSQISQSEDEDRLIWLFTASGQLAVRSFYKSMKSQCVIFSNKFLWKVKIPLKIKTFLWLMLKDSILTRDNLWRRGWKGVKSCLFCGADESIDHLFFQCPVANFVWKVVNISFGFNIHHDEVSHLFGTWLGQFRLKQRKMVGENRSNTDR